ncbi:MAG: hypothetical protein D3907_12150 [Candidatus Electrothrix sp. AUS3]|nr:hypothetical protein [Candidatus Electrothrix gigas]
MTPFVQAQSKLDFFATARSIGSPSRILRWRCTTHKTNPLSKLINSMSPNIGVLTFDGIRRAESTRRSKYSRLSDQHKIAGETELAVWIYISHIEQ